MARTLYKKNSLTLSSQFIESESASCSRENVFHYNGSRNGSQATTSRRYHTQGDSVNPILNVWDDDISNLSNEATDTNESALPSVFCWRKYLYFGLSKPTHFDVELLNRLRNFGKMKAVLVLLLPLLVLLVCGVAPKTLNPSDRLEIAAITEESRHNILFNWWPVDSLAEQFSPHKIEPKEEEYPSIINQMLSKAEMKTLIDEVLREEIMPLLLSKESSHAKQDFGDVKDIKKELSAFNDKMSSVSEILHTMQVTAAEESQKSSTLREKNLEQEKQFQELNGRIKSLQEQIVVLDGLLTSSKNCCRNGTEMEHQATVFLLSMMSASPNNPTAKLFQDWLSARHISNKQFQEEIKKVQETAASGEAQVKSAVASFVKEEIDAIRKDMKTLTAAKKRGLDSDSMSHDMVEQIVKDAIDLYDADKTGQTDYALESGGGAVVNTRCSEPYNEGKPSFVLFGIPLWNMKSSPRYAIQPDMYPGNCWAFAGSQGYLIVQLSATIRPTSFVIEHIQKSLSPTERIDSAPKDFSVKGLSFDKDEDGVLLGEYSYDKDGEPLQFFPVQKADSRSYSFIELQIHSNHGDPKYTCLYRFRVHGIRA